MARKTPRTPSSNEFEKARLQANPAFSYPLLDAIDESPEFHDPYSELNLFLSRKIKKEMRHCSNSKKWSIELQEELLQKITPDFQKQFPQYRLGISALKQTWEKLSYFSSQIQGKKEALTQEGKLNIPFFIKENLKTTQTQRQACHLHPYHYAHQLAAKMGECIAVVDGTRPKLDQLTRTIWSLQRHLIPELNSDHYRSPYDESDQIDKLIIKAILDIGAKHPQLSQTELSYYVKRRLNAISQVANDYSSSEIKKMAIAIWADLTHLPTQRIEKTLEQIPYSIAKRLKNEMASLFIDKPTLSKERIIQECVTFFEKSHGAIAQFEEEAIEQKIQNWTIQGDMLLRWIRMDHASPLYQLLEQKWRKSPKADLQKLTLEVQKEFLEKHPTIAPVAPYLQRRTWIYLKYLWYTQAFEEKVPTFDRFLLWQKKTLPISESSKNELIENVEKICKKILPLMPFHKTRVQTVVFAKEEDESNKDHRKAQ